MADQERGGWDDTPAQPDPDERRDEAPAADGRASRPTAEESAAAQWYPQPPPGDAQWYRQPPPEPRSEQPPAVEPAAPAGRPQWYAPGPSPRPEAPPVPAVRRDPGELVGERAHGDALMRRVGQGVAHIFRPAEEVQTTTRFGEWVQHPITTGRRIAVTSIRGGAGKSTVAALIATVYGHYRQDRVLALDVDPGLGSLALRLGITPTHSLGDLDESTARTGSFDDVQPYLTRAGRQVWVLPGTRSAVHDSTLDAGAYQGAAVPLSRFFALTVVDCGAGLLGELPRTVLSGAHAQILVTHATFDGALSAREALDWMVQSGLSELVLRTVVVFVARNPDAESLLDVGRATALVREPGAGAVRFGYDRHVALGTTLDARRLSYATRLTGVRIAAEAMRRAVNA